MKQLTPLEALGRAIAEKEIAEQLWLDHRNTKPDRKEGRRYARANLRAKAEHHLIGHRYWEEFDRAQAKVNDLTQQLLEDPS